jgi:hypothetical protein
MNFKTTAFLLLALLVLGGYTYNYVINKPRPPAEPRPFVYQFEMTDIVAMELRHDGRTTNVYLDQATDEWKFVDPDGGEVDAGRLNGIRLLLSGPGANRLLFADPTQAQLAEFGFNSPSVIANITLKDGTRHQVLLGDLTHDGRNYYTKNSDSNTVYLVDYTWGNELKRFVNEPPVMTATETPA